uniref:NmrA-like domain-containing protein n=1 Tax=Aegilops tauschii subsp. strangulata TaxID=200361 RepID=A0A453IGK0_AEGTS
MPPCEEEEVPRSGPALIVGATGYIGRFVAEACLDSGRRTFILVRPGNACPARAASVDALLRKGALVVEGRVDGKDGGRSVETALRAHGVEVVISVMGGANILDQLGLIKAIQAAGTVKVRTRARANTCKFVCPLHCDVHVATYTPACMHNGPVCAVRTTEVSAVGVRARRGQGAPGGGRGGVLRGEAARPAGGGGGRRALHLHLLQLHRRLAILRQHAPVRGAPAARPLPDLRRWHRQSVLRGWN